MHDLLTIQVHTQVNNFLSEESTHPISLQIDLRVLKLPKTLEVPVQGCKKLANSKPVIIVEALSHEQMIHLLFALRVVLEEVHALFRVYLSKFEGPFLLVEEEPLVKDFLDVCVDVVVADQNASDFE